MNLFFIHTPFQLLVAQNLIIKKELSNNILILGHTGENAKHFYSIFDIMLIDNLWNSKIVLGDLNKGIYSFKSPLSSYFKLLKFSKRARNIVISKNSNSLYFGDINHPAYIFLVEKWQKQYKINFFEEGLSHYRTPFFKKKFENSRTLKFKKYLTDTFIFKSLGVSNFSKYLQSVKDVDFELQIDRKYNILPVKKYLFEEIVKFDLYKSDNLVKLLNKEFEKIIAQPKVGVLYLSSTSSYLFSNPIEDEIQVIFKLIDKLNLDNRTKNGFLFYIKFHPKDSSIKKAAILKALRNANVTFYELSKNTAYPVEVLFNEISIEILFGFGSSAQLYCEMLNSYIASYNLFYNLKELYKSRNDINNYPAKSWINWENLFISIFKKQPLKYE